MRPKGSESRRKSKSRSA
jgi:hypothetical protein